MSAPQLLTTIDLRDLADTQALGAYLAARLRAGDVVALDGDLGAGKTTLARAVITALGYRGDVPSPSFTIIETYDPPEVRLPVVHADFYRLENPGEANEIGLDAYRDGAALIAEWPERAGGFAAEAGCLSITLALHAMENGEQIRRAIVSGGADWLERW